MMVKYFLNPFAVGGDKTAIPDASQPSGAISYNDGYGPNYSKPETESGSLPVSRLTFNELMYDTTSNIQQYQQHSTPEFITTVDNGGVPFPYAKDSVVRYDAGSGMNIYQSLSDANNTLPTDATKWRIINTAGSSEVLASVNVTFEGTVANGDAVYYNTGASNFQKAIANGTASQRVLGIADVTNRRILMAGQTAVLTGLTAGALYYLSGTITGALTTTAPIVNAIPVGIAISATQLFINIGMLSPSVNFKFTGAAMSMVAETTIVPQTFTTVSPAIGLINFNSVDYDTCAMANPTTHTMTVPFTGYWRIDASVTVTNAGATPGSFGFGIRVNSEVGLRKRIGYLFNISVGGDPQDEGSGVLLLNAGDVVGIYGSLGGFSPATIPNSGAINASIITAFIMEFVGN